MEYEKLKEAFVQGQEREAAMIFQQVLRQAVRQGLFAAIKE